SSRRRHTRFSRDWSSDVCSSDLTAYQTLDVVRAMEQDAQLPLTNLRVDGGMVANKLLMQFQADMLDVQVIAPKVTETTALGAARSEERRVGKEGRSRWSESDENK